MWGGGEGDTNSFLYNVDMLAEGIFSVILGLVIPICDTRAGNP